MIHNADEFTPEEFSKFLEYKIKFVEHFKCFSSLPFSDKKKLFVLSNVVIDLLKTLKKVDPETFIYIIQKLNKGEQSE